jgi:hypothetical protein
MDMKKILFTICIFLLTASPAYALNQSSNWAFTGNATNWDATNGTGTDFCGNTTSATETNFNIFAYDNGNFKSAENTTTNSVQERGRITQNITIPGTGNQKVRGGLTYSTTGSIWSTANTSWVRLDIYDSADSSYVATIGCVGFNTNVATTTIGFDTNVTLTGGTKYRLRATMKLRNVATDGVQNVWIDNVVLTTPPVNPAASAAAGTTNTSLSWDVSTATTTAPAIHATTPYKVYRGASSGAETFLANATTNSYSDTSTTGNTTYYYWITNLDTSSYESASSTEVSVLTLPAAPTLNAFSAITSSGMTVNWSAPAGGAATYKVERCLGTGCSDYAEISAGGAGTSYIDTELLPSTIYRYRVRATNATGDGVYSSASEQATDAAPPSGIVPPTSYLPIAGGRLIIQGGYLIMR